MPPPAAERRTGAVGAEPERREAPPAPLPAFLHPKLPNSEAAALPGGKGRAPLGGVGESCAPGKRRCKVRAGGVAPPVPENGG